jgi:hypothetical protein
MYTYQAGIAEMNRQVQLQNASYERYIGEVKAQELGMKTRAEVGATLAAQGASNLDVSSGSGVRVRESELELGQYDQAITRANAYHRAYGMEIQAATEEAKEQMALASASTAREAGTIGAISSILGGVSSVSSKWLQGQQTGVFNSPKTPSSYYEPGGYGFVG